MKFQHYNQEKLIIGSKTVNTELGLQYIKKNHV